LPGRLAEAVLRLTVARRGWSPQELLLLAVLIVRPRIEQ